MPDLKSDPYSLNNVGSLLLATPAPQVSPSLETSQHVSQDTSLGMTLSAHQAAAKAKRGVSQHLMNLMKTSNDSAALSSSEKDSKSPPLSPSSLLHPGEVTQAGMIQSISPIKKALSPFKFRMAHPEYGDVQITSEGKETGKDKIQFRIELNTPDNQQIIAEHTMGVKNKDPWYQKSTLGYDDIEFSTDLRGKGIAHIYHYTAAKIAQQLGVDLFTIDNVASPAMHKLCQNGGMKAESDEAYKISPSQLLDNLRPVLGLKRWTEVKE